VLQRPIELGFAFWEDFADGPLGPALGGRM
jgi:hypothetical protein